LLIGDRARAASAAGIPELDEPQKGGDIEMAGLLKHTRLAGIALVLTLGLTVLPGLVTPLLGDELASWLPGTDVVLADGSQGSGG
jgi:hypothetical protein